MVSGSATSHSNLGEQNWLTLLDQNGIARRRLPIIVESDTLADSDIRFADWVDRDSPLISPRTNLKTGWRDRQSPQTFTTRSEPAADRLSRVFCNGLLGQPTPESPNTWRGIGLGSSGSTVMTVGDLYRVPLLRAFAPVVDQRETELRQHESHEWSAYFAGLVERSGERSGAFLLGEVDVRDVVANSLLAGLWSDVSGIGPWPGGGRSIPAIDYGLQSGETSLELETAPYPDSSGGSAPVSGLIEEIENASSEFDISELLRSNGFMAVAKRIEDLIEDISDDPDETPMDIDSLRALAAFIANQSWLPTPEVGVGYGGRLEVAWRIRESNMNEPEAGRMPNIEAHEQYWGRGDGMIALVFLTDGRVQFAAASGPLGLGVERLTANGTLTAEEMLEAIRTFTARLVRQ